MIRRVRLLQRAQRDLEAIDAYLTSESPAAATKVLDALLDAIERLDVHAARAPTPRDPRLAALGFRILVRRPYLVFFRIHKAEVRVHRVLHGHRAYQHLL